MMSRAALAAPSSSRARGAVGCAATSCARPCAALPAAAYAAAATAGSHAARACGGLRRRSATASLSATRTPPGGARRRGAVAPAVVAAAGGGGEVTVLVADIGGTNARFALWRAGADGAGAAEVHAATYQGRSFPTFDAVLAAFMAEPPVAARPPAAAVFSVAGAVEGNACVMTNLPWVVDGGALTKRLGFRSGRRLLAPCSPTAASLAGRGEGWRLHR
jgi:hypothetical protein